MDERMRTSTFSEEETSAILGGVFVGHVVELSSQNFGTTEELHDVEKTSIEFTRKVTYHTNISVRMFLGEGIEDTVPVGSTKVSWCPQRCNGILLSTDLLDNDIVHVVLLNLGREVNIDLDLVLSVLFFDGAQKRVEPFSCTIVTNDPGEVDFGQPGVLAGRVEVVHPVPDGFEDSR